jgi:hypothetical protein
MGSPGEGSHDLENQEAHTGKSGPRPRSTLKDRAGDPHDAERIVFARPIGKNQAIQHPLAECGMRLQSTELLMGRRLRSTMRASPCGVEGHGGQVPRRGGQR